MWNQPAGFRFLNPFLEPLFRTWEPTMLIRNYLKDHAAFEPDAITAMSDALEQACTALHVNGHIRDREVIATRIIDRLDPRQDA